MSATCHATKPLSNVSPAAGKAGTAVCGASVMAASDNQSYSYKSYQPERLAITPGTTGLVAWRWVAESMFSSKYNSSGISLPQPMGRGTDPGSSYGFGASMPADDGPGGITILR